MQIRGKKYQNKEAYQLIRVSLLQAACYPNTHTLLPFSFVCIFAKESLENMMQDRQDQAGVAGIGNGTFS